MIRLLAPLYLVVYGRFRLRCLSIASNSTEKDTSRRGLGRAFRLADENICVPPGLVGLGGTCYRTGVVLVAIRPHVGGAA